MTLDELWPERAFVHSVDALGEVGLFADSALRGSAIDDLDEGEINRFLQLLEMFTTR